jgi:hypothetical protein
MALENNSVGAGLLGSPFVGLASAIAGFLFIPYALTKGYLTTVIIAESWQVASLTVLQTANLFHVLESVPLAFMALGLVSLDRRCSPQSWVAAVGETVAIAGFAATILTHLGEHLLPPLTVTGLLGGQNLYMWAYYGSWLLLYTGLAIYGVALVQLHGRPRWLGTLLVAVLPLSVGFGLVLVMLDLFTLAGTFRVLQGLIWVFVGAWLFRQRAVTTRLEGTVGIES